jgi:trigger factor
VLERKFGEELRGETMENIIEKSLKTIFDEIEEKPLAYSVPEMDRTDYKFSPGEDFSFAVSYDIFPTIELGPYTGLTVEQPQVKIGAEDEERELEVYVEHNSFILEKDGAAAAGDIATITYWETDETGAEIPDTRQKDKSLTLGKNDSGFDFDNDIVGMAKGETKAIVRDFPAGHEKEELAGKTKRFTVELTGLREKKRPEINDELAQDISDDYDTLDDLKKDIRKRLEESAEIRRRQLTTDAFMNQVAEKSSIDLPESMIRAEQEHLWRQFMGRLNIPESQLERMMAASDSSHDALFEKWRPGAEKSLKIQLLFFESP